MVQRSIDITLSVLAGAVSFLLSWPYWRSFGYWAESGGWWFAYFVAGFLLAVFVFYVFFRSLRTLFAHEGPGHAHAHAEGHTHDHPPLEGSLHHLSANGEDRAGANGGASGDGSGTMTPEEPTA